VSRRYSWLGSLLLLLFFTVGPIYFFEGYLSWRSNSSGAPKTHASAVQHLRNANFNWVPYFLTNFFYPPRQLLSFEGSEILPLSGLSYSNTLLCNEKGVWESFTSDRYGFSNPDGVWDSESVDALLVGDSFVLGECLPLHWRFSTLIQNRLSKSINLGYSASSTLSALARLREFAGTLHPKTIFISVLRFCSLRAIL